jgi:hypothetical protein
MSFYRYFYLHIYYYLLLYYFFIIDFLNPNPIYLFLVIVYFIFYDSLLSSLYIVYIFLTLGYTLKLFFDYISLNYLVSLL